MSDQSPSEAIQRKRGARLHPVVEHPESLRGTEGEPADFASALDFHMRRHGDTSWRLWRSLTHVGLKIDVGTLAAWRRGAKAPRAAGSLAALAGVEHRYRLPSGHLLAKLPHPSRLVTGRTLGKLPPAERRRLAWHLPIDFDRRSAAEQNAILTWVRRVILAGTTEYRSYQAEAAKTRFALRFPCLDTAARQSADMGGLLEDDRHVLLAGEAECGRSPGGRTAPPRLTAEMARLLVFKTSTLAPPGLQRSGVWNGESALQRLEHLALLLGALTAPRHGPVQGAGLPLSQATLALLVFPAVWDWYLTWRERKRGFYTQWEVDMLRLGQAFTRRGTGWLRQSPDLAEALTAIEGLVSQADVAAARENWDAACDAVHAHAGSRAKEVKRVARVHRDGFEPILPVLEAESPVGEYRKIVDEVVRRMPDGKRYPKDHAEALRALLMLRFGLHLGLRQKNLRQLLFCPRGREPLSERRLTQLRRGELRWSDRGAGWEVFIPHAAFKNGRSAFFASSPFRLVLPNLDGLYTHLASYVERYRAVLLGGADDPGTFFIKTVKATSRSAAYNQTTFYEAWRASIQRYGIFNPYTGRGAIAGLLPHGPHSVRDVLATHVLKQTGSFEQASYAIQDTPDMVAKHYARFLPQHKASLAAKVLDRAWE